MYPVFTERELGYEVFKGDGRLEEMPYMSKANFSGGNDARIPIRILVRDNNKVYTIFFFQSRFRDEVSDEREKNIAELVRAYYKGARISVTGAVINKETLEESLEDTIITDSSMHLGIITLMYNNKIQRYTYLMDFGKPYTKDTTILVKGDYVIPGIIEMHRKAQKKKDNNMLRVAEAWA